MFDDTNLSNKDQPSRLGAWLQRPYLAKRAFPDSTVQHKVVEVYLILEVD